MTTANGEDKKINWLAIFVFLLITFVITYAVEFGFIFYRGESIIHGFGQYLVAIAMWVPAFSALIVTKFILKKPLLKSLRISFGTWKPYLITLIFVPLCFIVIYGLTYLFSFGSPDWSILLLKNEFLKQGIKIPEIPENAWLLLYLSTLLIAPVINTVFALGEEIGWRGFLLYQLLPLGKWWAGFILAVVWALWHLPLVVSGFMYPGYPILGNGLFVLLTLSFGIFMNELTLRYNSSLLAGWIHGVFNSQRLGVWALLFPSLNVVMGGQSGIIGVIIWTGLGLMTNLILSIRNN